MPATQPLLCEEPTGFEQSQMLVTGTVLDSFCPYLRSQGAFSWEHTFSNKNPWESVGFRVGRGRGRRVPFGIMTEVCVLMCDTGTTKDGACTSVSLSLKWGLCLPGSESGSENTSDNHTSGSSLKDACPADNAETGFSGLVLRVQGRNPVSLTRVHHGKFPRPRAWVGSPVAAVAAASGTVLPSRVWAPSGTENAPRQC